MRVHPLSVVYFKVSKQIISTSTEYGYKSFNKEEKKLVSGGGLSTFFYSIDLVYFKLRTCWLVFAYLVLFFVVLFFACLHCMFCIIPFLPKFSNTCLNVRLQCAEFSFWLSGWLWLKKKNKPIPSPLHHCACSVLFFLNVLLYILCKGHCTNNAEVLL